MSDLFLTSTHLPAHLVAAFAKRASRLALSAPPNAILAVVPFVGNLLMRHRSLIKMLLGESGDKGDGDDDVMERDPYNPDEPDPAKSGASDSYLWELQALERHVLPQVSQCAKNLSRRLNTQPDREFDLGEVLELEMNDLMEQETKKKPFVNVPLNFKRPVNDVCFPDGDLTSKYFKME